MRRILIAAVASSLLTGAAIAATGVARTGDSGDEPPPTMAQALERHEAQRDARLGRVARRLDVSTGALKAAIAKARDARLDRAVADGRLTRAQREAIEACRSAPLTCDRSNLPAPRRMHRRGARPDLREHRREMRSRRGAFLAAVARELGKDAGDVRRAFRAERPRMGRGPRGHRGAGGPDVPGGPGGPLMPPPGG